MSKLPNNKKLGSNVSKVSQVTNVPKDSVPEELIPRKGNYKALITYQKAESVYDITYYFCSKYLRRGDRTIDQMVQAARSGKQNIVEGSAASATSSEMEIKLVSVAKASLHELLVDYEDYLRTRAQLAMGRAVQRVEGHAQTRTRT